LDYLKTGVSKRNQSAQMAARMSGDNGEHAGGENLSASGRLFLFVARLCSFLMSISAEYIRSVAGNHLAWAKYPRRFDDYLITHNYIYIVPIEMELWEIIHDAFEQCLEFSPGNESAKQREKTARS
jgi:hypothetical protein